MTYILFDIGGTKTRVTYTDDVTSFSKVVSYKTPTDFKTGIEKITAEIATFNVSPTAIAGGVRGLLSEDKTGIANDSILKKWAGKSIVDAFRDVYGDIPVLLENDTAMAGVGEAVFGAGKGLEIVAYHTVSTGVGGVKVENGDIDDASLGFEPGHQILDIDRTILGSDISPTLENLVSGTAVEQRFGIKPYEIPQSDSLWDELAEYLAQGLRNTILYWSPDAIVLGGSMITGNPAINVDAIRKYTVAALDGFVPSPLITAAKLGDEGALYGAMAILKRL